MSKVLHYVPVASGLFAAAVLIVWLLAPVRLPLTLRVPGTDGRPDASAGSGREGNPVLRGRVTLGPGKPAELAGTWSRFRGDSLASVGKTSSPLLREWPEAGPRKLWSIDVGEGYAGAAIVQGRAFMMDYDRERKQEALRCLSLLDGQEIWRYSFPNTLKRDHGVTRTVPALAGGEVVAIGPKCHVLCVNATNGTIRWTIDMVKEYGATIPPWYTGQNPLLDNDRVILAPAGPQALLLAVERTTGKIIWRSPNPRGWKMTHSSVMPVEFNGKRIYVYCASGGVAGVSAEDGSILWDTTDWKINIATVPCPLDLGGGRIFLCGGYNAGSMLLQLKQEGARITPTTAFRLKTDVFGATQHAPILHRDHLFGVRAPDGRLVCLSLDGRVAWTSEAGSNFGLGSFCIVNDLIFALNDSGTLHLVEATPEAYRPLAKAKVLEGPESWGPMAFADGRLIARDLYKLVCLDVGVH